MDTEAVQKVIERILETQKEFREVEMRLKLKECQGIRNRGYQHQEKYIEGDKVWYQYKDGKAWFGPASVICQKGNMVFIHSNGQIVKVAMCKAKPYELQLREVNRQENNMVKDKDGKDILEEDEKIEDKQTEMEDRQIIKEDGLNDIIGAISSSI